LSVELPVSGNFSVFDHCNELDWMLQTIIDGSEKLENWNAY